MKKSKNILIIMLIVIEIVATYFMYKSSTNKEVVLDNVELKEIKKDSSFAIMVEKTEGSGEYQEYQNSTWPSNYNFNANKSSCINEKGEIVSGVLTFDESANKAYVTNTTQTTYCYLYFDLPITETVPTCTFNVTNTNGSISITMNKSDNTEKWYIGTQSIDPTKDENYNNLSSLSAPYPGEVYGYVKNSSGFSGCHIESKKSTTSGCHSASGSTGGSSSGGTCYGVSYSCTESGSCSQTNATATEMKYCTSGSGNCGLTTYWGNGKLKSYCHFEVRGGSGGGVYSIWTCQSDVSKTYRTQSECESACGSIAGTCEAGYNRAVGGAADGSSGSWALCWK